MVLQTSQDDGDAENSEIVSSLASELDRLNHITKLSRSDELRLSGDWLHALLNEVSDYLYVKGRSSRFVMANLQVALDVGLDDASQLIGKTDLEISMIMSRSRATVRFHIHNAATKLNAVNRSQTVFKAAQLGYISLQR